MQHWALEQENQRLEREIKERNELFTMRVKRKSDAATKIQRAYKRWVQSRLLTRDLVGNNSRLNLPEHQLYYHNPLISTQRVQTIPLQQINFNDYFRPTA
mmetsp:Transcript_28310/g.42858  ORF Transcript_28310/g.42858 Transcript_28310/m.42858 type:complete len:100 (+) Transcript_28310:584-883(+)